MYQSGHWTKRGPLAGYNSTTGYRVNHHRTIVGYGAHIEGVTVVAGRPFIYSDGVLTDLRALDDASMSFEPLTRIASGV
jgi:hypothetical protein